MAPKQPGLIMMLRADGFRQHGHSSLLAVAKSALTRRCFRPIVTLRLCQHAAATRRPLRWLLLPPCKILHRIATQLAGMDLSWHTRIGPGFCIVHGWGLVISPGATLGGNVTVFHGVTLGRNDRASADGSVESRFPNIADEVWIGPHAIIVGGVTVGEGSRVAGGAFITRDVAPHTLIGGNPAVVLKEGCAPDVMNKVARAS